MTYLNYAVDQNGNYTNRTARVEQNRTYTYKIATGEKLNSKVSKVIKIIFSLNFLN